MGQKMSQYCRKKKEEEKKKIKKEEEKKKDSDKGKARGQGVVL